MNEIRCYRSHKPPQTNRFVKTTFEIRLKGGDVIRNFQVSEAIDRIVKPILRQVLAMATHIAQLFFGLPFAELTIVPVSNRKTVQSVKTSSMSNNTQPFAVTSGSNRNPDLIVLILGSAPDVMRAATWPKQDSCKIVSINNAWKVREDWDYNIYPEDFPAENTPERISGKQKLIHASTYVPANNQFGGIVYAGATMAFTAGYWALSALKPRVMAYLGCDMVYSGRNTHFYGQGMPDPLREDVTLVSLEAKSARLMAISAKQNCACVNLSEEPESRLLFPKVQHKALSADIPIPEYDADLADKALSLEQEAGYLIEDGRYWQHAQTFNPDVLAEIDKHWLAAVKRSMKPSAITQSDNQPA